MDAEEKLIEEIAKSDNSILQEAFLGFQEERINKNMQFAEKLENCIKNSNKPVFNDLNTIKIFMAIADFLGWQKVNKIDEIYYQVPNLYPILNLIEKENSSWTEVSIKNFEFNWNWNWLMSVIEKISKQGIFEEEYTHRLISTNYPRTFGMINEDGLFMFRFNNYALHCSEKLIDAAFKAVGEYLLVNGFIKD